MIVLIWLTRHLTNSFFLVGPLYQTLNYITRYRARCVFFLSCLLTQSGDRKKLFVYDLLITSLDSIELLRLFINCYEDNESNDCREVVDEIMYCYDLT